MYWVPIERGFLIIRKEGANPVLIELTEMLINLACVFIALIDK